MNAAGFLQDLTVVLSVAGAVLLLFKRLGWPPVLGYLVAGVIIGPYTPPMPLITDARSLEALADIGVVFLLFALGVEFNLKRLAKVGVKALICAGIEAAVMVTAGYYAGAAMGWAAMDALLLGAVAALASTAIVARTLLERARHAAGWEEIVSGMLIGEDIIAVLLLALLASSSAAGPAALSLSAMTSTLTRFCILATLVLTTGLLVFPRILRIAERSGMEEVRTLAIIGICFGVSLLTEKLGFSAALGAFLAGALASTGGSGAKLHETVAPFKDVFGAVFFVSVGMLIDPTWPFQRWELVLGLTLLVVAARMLANFFALAAVGEDKVSAVQASLAALPIGEFSFLLAALAQKRGLTQQPIYPLAVTFCLGTTLASALLLPPALASPESIRRAFPGPLERLLSDYRAALKRLSAPSRATQVWMLTRPSLFQIALNLAGISGLFLGAGALRSRWALDEVFPGAAWMAAAFLSLPFLLALARKTQAVTLILLEAVYTRGTQDSPPGESRPVFTRFLLGSVTLFVAWWYLSLSLPLLPPFPYAFAPLAVIGLAGAALWRRMNRIYANLQVALRETLARQETGPETSPTVLAHFVSSLAPEKVHVVSFLLEEGAWAVGRTIREVGLRAASGASILQVNRGKEALPSPGPEVKLEEDDDLLLIGETEQIRLARKVLTSGPA